MPHVILTSPSLLHGHDQLVVKSQVYHVTSNAYKGSKQKFTQYLFLKLLMLVAFSAINVVCYCLLTLKKPWKPGGVGPWD